MYITTFYSFKGGVGRTLALVNAGAELMRRGKRVLLVDFDLEAPGITTFPRLQPPPGALGIVDFITTFVATRTVPKVQDYIYEAVDCQEGVGKLWVMPAGLNDDGYARQLAAIDWQKLYTDQDGFLLFEDMKAQWKRQFQPDYVLIDSRTGHSEATGICTRQLPNSVCILFFPNEQNLSGLRKVVREIREEEDGPRSQHIDIHFVMSNVPDLDDEDQIIAKRMDDFASVLGYRTLAGTIHRYDSLALLNQAIFALERPMSRLTREYRALVDSITRFNLEDSSVALERLAQIGRQSYGNRRPSIEKLRNEVGLIAQLHPNEPRILQLLARLEQDFGNLDESLRFIQRSISLGNRKPQALLFRAEILQLSGETKAAEADILEALDSDEMPPATLRRLLGLLRRLSPGSMPSIPKSRAVKSMPLMARIDLCYRLLWTRPGAEAAAEIAREAASQILVTDRENWTSAKRALLLCLISARQFQSAIRVVDEFQIAEKGGSPPMDIQFNRACAIWGATRKVPLELFENVLLLDKANTEEPDENQANYDQCIALAMKALKRDGEAKDRISAAGLSSRAVGPMIFSSWRYLNVTGEDFRRDCENILSWDQSTLPEFIADIPSSPKKDSEPSFLSS